MGGAEISLGNLVSCLDEEIELTLLGVERSVLEQVAARRPGTGTMVVPDVRDKTDVAAIMAQLRAIRRLHPRILHANLQSPWSSSYAIAAGLLLPGIKVLAVEHLPMPSESPPQRLLKRLASRRLDAHVAVGVRSARAIEEIVGLRAGTLDVIHNGVPDEEAAPAVDRPDGRTVIGSLGRLDPQKGYDTLLRAASELPYVEVLLVGDGPEQEALERLARELGLGDRLRILGWSAEPRRHLAEFDVFALPSRFEGFPLSILEAMLSGLPVIATTVGSVPESVVDGDTGLLVPPDDVAGLRAAIDELAGRPELRTRMGNAGRERARRLFLAEGMARRYEALYRGLAESTRS